MELPKGGIYWLGPNLTLRRCTVAIGVAGRWLTLMPARLIDCTIEVKRELVDARWTQMALSGCRFKGRFHGCEFGHRPDDMDGWELDGVEDCDFSEAQLEHLAAGEGRSWCEGILLGPRARSRRQRPAEHQQGTAS